MRCRYSGHWERKPRMSLLRERRSPRKLLIGGPWLPLYFAGSMMARVEVTPCDGCTHMRQVQLGVRVPFSVSAGCPCCLTCSFERFFDDGKKKVFCPTSDRKNSKVSVRPRRHYLLFFGMAMTVCAFNLIRIAYIHRWLTLVGT